MKAIAHLVIFFTILLPSSLIAQWTYLGLGDKTGTKIELVENEIYVGTTNGFFKKELNNSDTVWTVLGLEGKEITDFVIFNSDTILVSTYVAAPATDVSLFMTYNNGASWNDYQNGFGGNSGYNLCSSLEICPTAPDTIFARAGFCIAKSTDQGNTWQEVYESWIYGGVQGHFIYDIFPNNPETIWAGGESSFGFPYLFKSTDYGNNWQFIEIDGGGDNICRTLIRHPDNNNKILVGLREYIKLSTDEGENWSTVFQDESYSIHDLEISPNNNELVYAAGRRFGQVPDDLFFLKSFDFGLSWDTIKLPSNSNSYNVKDIEIIDEDSNDDLFFATNHGIYRYSNSLINVDEFANQNLRSWRLYPNPMIEIAMLNFNNFGTENHTFTLQDVQGNCVRTISNITTNQVIINKAKLPKGLYIFQLRNNREVYATGKLIIN
ncbi:MAG: hypothetical protein DRJ05_18535 [Bacteroidetes bacterium]|nr:MAG: hypothetical protein DRJ05_18535 [Bacteroidota bacterium]